MVKHTQTIRRQQPTNCLSVFNHYVGLVLKGLIAKIHCSQQQKNNFCERCSIKTLFRKFYKFSLKTFMEKSFTNEGTSLRSYRFFKKAITQNTFQQLIPELLTGASGTIFKLSIFCFLAVLICSLSSSSSFPNL